MAKIVSTEALHDLKANLAPNAASQAEILSKLVPEAPSADFYNASLSLEKDMVSLRCAITVGASGAVTSFDGKGIKSVTKEVADGQYTVELTAAYSKFLELRGSVISASISDVTTVQALMAPATIDADIASTGLVVQCLDAAGAAANAASGEVINLMIVMSWAK